MQIKILGIGCPSCKKLEENTKQAILELEMEVEVEKVTDMEKIMGYGIMSLPAIVLDDEVLSYGAVPSVADIKKLLAGSKDSSNGAASGCSCGKSC